MKKSIYHIVASAMILTCYSANAQSQLYRWAITPVQIEMQTNPQVDDINEFPSSGSIAPVNSLTYQAAIANGMYDKNNELLFYISNEGVYDKYSSLIGYITPAPKNAEIVVVPFGNNGTMNGVCQNKFNIFTMAMANNYASVIQSVLDMDNYTLSAGMIADQFPYQVEFGAMAASKAIYGVTGTDRFLYSIAASGTGGNIGGEVRRLTIHDDGSISNAAFFYKPPYSSEVNCFTQELDLSPDGNYLLWASWLHDLTPNNNRERYHLLDVNTTTNYVQFEIPNTPNNNTGFRGVEFDASSTKLYLGAGPYGIYETNLTHTYFNQVINSWPFYGSSQIELSFNGKMYVAKNDNSGVIDCFNPSSPSLAMLGTPDAFILWKSTNTNPTEAPKINWQSSGDFYTLPDQIDGEDYSANLSPPTPQGGSISTYDFDQGTAVWQYGTTTSDNP